MLQRIPAFGCPVLLIAAWNGWLAPSSMPMTPGVMTNRDVAENRYVGGGLLGGVGDALRGYGDGSERGQNLWRGVDASCADGPGSGTAPGDAVDAPGDAGVAGTGDRRSESLRVA